MKHVSFAAVVFCVLCFTSCREKPATGPTMVNRQFTLPTGNPSVLPSNQALPASNTTPGSAAINPAHGQPGHRCDIAVGAPLPSGSTPAIGATPVTGQNSSTQASLPAVNNSTPAKGGGVNPAHGQPGHRCDIAVGAPLDSKPTTTSTTPATPTVTKPVALPPDTMFAKGLNPAHGQPGHRCDIAVGKPLNEAKKTDDIPSTIAAPVQPVEN